MRLNKFLWMILDNHEDGLMLISYLFGRLAAYGDDADPEEIIEAFLNVSPETKERVREAINESN